MDNERATRSSAVHLVGDLLRPRRGTLIVIMAAMVAQTLMSLAAPWPLKIVIDTVVAGQRQPRWIEWALRAVGADEHIHLAVAAGIATVVIAVITALAMYTASYCTETLSQGVGNDLRVRLFHRLQGFSLSYFDTHRLGTMLSTLTSDVQAIQGLASAATLHMVTNTLTVVGMVVVMVLCRWDFTLIALAVTPLVAVFVLRVNKAIKSAVREVRIHQSDLLSTLQEGLQSMHVVQAFGREEHQEQKMRHASTATVTAWLRARRVSSVLSPVVSVAIAVCTGLVLWRGAMLIADGTMTIGSLTVFLAYLARFFQPVRDLAQMTSTIAQASVALDRVLAVSHADAAIVEQPDALPPPPLRGEITFEHVGFGYCPGQTVLRDITFAVEPGQKVGIVGPTGSGKSTLASLIPRFRDIDSGAIIIDGVDIRDYTLSGLRAQIGFVLQDTVLLHGTVRQNIAFGRPDATEEQIMHAAVLANAHDFIVRMPGGYDSMVGDRGATLSGGQRQRIGIARALIRDNPILILDEPTAALDAESEASVVQALDRLMAGRTVITIAHRLSTLRNADVIVVVDNGVIAESGTPAELLDRDGLYARMHRLQFDDRVPVAG